MKFGTKGGPCGASLRRVGWHHYDARPWGSASAGASPPPGTSPSGSRPGWHSSTTPTSSPWHPARPNVPTSSAPATTSPAGTAPTRRSLPMPTSTWSTSPRPTPATRPTPCCSSAPASRCCARSRSRSAGPRPNAWPPPPGRAASSAWRRCGAGSCRRTRGSPTCSATRSSANRSWSRPTSGSACPSTPRTGCSTDRSAAARCSIWASTPSSWPRWCSVPPTGCRRWLAWARRVSTSRSQRCAGTRAARWRWSRRRSAWGCRARPASPGRTGGSRCRRSCTAPTTWWSGAARDPFATTAPSTAKDSATRPSRSTTACGPGEPRARSCRSTRPVRSPARSTPSGRRSASPTPASDRRVTGEREVSERRGVAAGAAGETGDAMTSRATPVPAVVERPEQLTAAWFDAVLGTAGTPASVERVTAASVGTGQMAQTLRVRLDRADGNGSTVIVKLARPEVASGPLARSAYAKEIAFYAELAARLPVRTPRCHHAAIADDAASFTLVLDDLAGAVPGDQIAGCPVAHAEAAVVNLAALHGPTWCDADLAGRPWLAGDPSLTPEMLAPVLDLAADQFAERFTGDLEDHERAVLDAARQVLAPWILAE